MHSQSRSRFSANLYGLLCLAVLILPARSQELHWPQEVTAPEGTIVIYQPQPEKLQNNVLTGRAAMSLEINELPDPIFGTFWFTGKLDTDRDSDTALVYDIKVLEVRWPESKDAQEQRFSAVVESAIPRAGLSISLERLSASLATAEVEQQSLENLKNDPPIIEFRDQLAVLLMYDGEPRYEAIENSGYERIVNTPFAVVRNKSAHYLSSGQLWYQADNPLGPWKVTSSPPADLVKMLPETEDASPPPSTPPLIVVATEPTELIATDGKPNWESLPGGEVLYVSNTESPWLRELSTGNMYVLLSGRWFRAKKTTGPWTFVRADELPASFANIPPASDIGGLRTSVAGTEEAQEAMLDAQIPQTAAISRSGTTLEVEYQGKPKFEKVTGTDVSYAVNTASQVLKVGNTYYAADNGVWFTSSAPTGPWQVADDIPQQEISQIPPSSPVYNTTQLHVYESTPEVVYVGYTPGYMWSFPYYGVPVYGTGWRYRPYPGPWYYPRPPTWGFNVGYNPWTGWSFGMSWSNGFFSMGVSFGGYNNRYRGGWYGAGGYRGPTIINTGDINIGNNVNVGNRATMGNKLERNANIRQGNLQRNNLYKRPENRTRNADRAVVQRDLQQARAARDRQNNVFAAQDGSVARLDNGKWQSREAGKWQDDDQLNRDITPQQRDKAAAVSNREPQKPQARPTTKPTAKSQPASYNRRHDLNQASRARAKGAARERAAPRRAPSRAPRRR